MKIAMIGHKDFPSRSGGIEVVVYELATRLVRKGWEVTVYNRERRHGENHGYVDGVEVYRCATPKNQNFNALIYSINATIKALTKRYDLIHYHALGPSAMILLARLFGQKTVATVHGLDWQRSKWNRLASAYLKFGERVIARYADEIIVLSPSEQKYFMETYGRETNLVRNAITPVTPCEPRQICSNYGLDKNQYVLYLGRLVPEKGVHLLIEAFQRCDTDKKLVIAGQVPDNEYGRSLRAMAEGSGRIIFAGFVSGQLLDELYSNCALYVLPSDVEGMALTLLEAMSAGARCLTSDIPENTAVLRDFGYTFKSGDKESLYESLRAALGESGENPRMQEQREYIAKTYNYDVVVEETEIVYNKVLSRE